MLLYEFDLDKVTWLIKIVSYYIISHLQLRLNQSELIDMIAILLFYSPVCN